MQVTSGDLAVMCLLAMFGIHCQQSFSYQESHGDMLFVSSEHTC